MNGKLGIAAAAALVTLAGRAALADQHIDVGGTDIVIPDPPGFTLVTPEMPRIYGLLDELIPARHARYAAYIPNELAAAARAGVEQDYLAILTVQDIVGVGDQTISRAEFAEVKDSIREQNDTMLREATAGMEGDPNIPAALATADYVPLPMHEETDSSASYLAFMHTSAETGANTGRRRMAATMTLVHTRSKALLLTVGVLDSELQRGSALAEAWADAVLAANEAP